MDWRTLFNDSCKSGDDIQKVLGLSDQETEMINEISEEYPMYVNRYYLSLINPEDKEDPIRRMAVPSPWEFEAGGSPDTSGEADNTKLPGLQHKYGQTALILSTNRCAMYCRHCFRKRMVGLNEDETASHMEAMAEYIREHPEINNVLISGGDAFLNKNERIKEYLNCFSKLEQLDYIRFGTRIPVVLPQRILWDEELLDILEEYNRKKQIYIITQFNHPRELTKIAVDAVKALTERGIVIKNQIVLLKGVNDDPDILTELLRKLTICGISPYYIFQCRPVRGVLNYFQVPLLEGMNIVDAAKARQSGQGKCLRYIMSHPVGKIEILGEVDNGKMLFKVHQAKDKKHNNRIFTKTLEKDQCWI